MSKQQTREKGGEFSMVTEKSQGNRGKKEVNFP